LYKGWKIYTYSRKISRAEIESTIKNKLKTWFESGELCFSANTHRIVIVYGLDEQEINVDFPETKYVSEKDGDVGTYQVVFSSIFFGYKTFQEKTHRELCKEIMQKITWKKRAVWLIDNAQIPIRRTRRLQMSAREMKR
jgi:hypothetical protein